jgi:hypothetical protein
MPLDMGRDKCKNSMNDGAKKINKGFQLPMSENLGRR